MAAHSGGLLGQDRVYDLVIYGGTAAGVSAAVQAKRMGRTVVVIEPTDRLGGLTSGGLGQTDIGNKAAIGGIAREFYRAVRRHYQDPSAWRWQSSESYQSEGQSRTSGEEDTMWTFEPSVALKILRGWIAEHQIDVAYRQRLDRSPGGVAMTRAIPWRILSIRMESGQTYQGAMFIDATYEGDLAAAAGVSYTVGRESNATYGETLNGVQVQQARSHQLSKGIDPYLIKGDESSGLLPHIDPSGPGSEGSGDHRVQAYCFRMCLTDHPENRIPFAKPAGYDETWYELLLRNFEAGETGVPWINSRMPNRKTDTNNRLGFSTDFIGQNYDYPQASYAQREAIIAQHLLYQKGLVWTLANHPRVPAHVRQEASRWGMCKDEFTEGEGWQEQLYIREARRIVADYVMTQHNCQGRAEVTDSVGLAAYTMDSHNQQRYVDSSGQVRNEGDVQVGGFSPYPISYRSIVPKRQQCANLLVPVCLSASHIAFGSIRMEPVFMVLGQSAATAAVHAIEQDVAVQEIDPQRLTARLLTDNQVLAWSGPKVTPPKPGLEPAQLPGLVIDDEQAELEGFSMSGHTVYPYVKLGYRHDGDTEKGHQRARFPFRLPRSGRYEVRIAYSAHDNRASNVPVVLRHADGEQTVMVNQRKTAEIDRLFQPLGRFRFEGNQPYEVAISNEGTDGYVILDAIQIVPLE
jgi:hypothetical protein